jgi:hypothetical protein
VRLVALDGRLVPLTAEVADLLHRSEVRFSSDTGPMESLWGISNQARLNRCFRVARGDYLLVLYLLRHPEKAPPLPIVEHRSDRICKACGRLNPGAFEICWSCGRVL